MGTFSNTILRLIYFILILCSTKITAQIKYEPTDVVLSRLQLNEILTDQTNSKAFRLVHIWDSLYPKCTLSKKVDSLVVEGFVV